MFHKKATTYEQMEKPKKEKKFKQNAYEEIRKIVEDAEATAVAVRSINEGNDIVKEVKTKRKQTIKKIHINLNYLIKYNLKILYLIKLSMLVYI